MRLISVLILSLSTLATALVVSPSASRSSSEPDVPPLVRTYLRERMGFSDTHLRDISRGHAVARVLDSDHGEDVSILGAVRIGAPASWLITRLRDITTVERTDAILSVANFSTPPRLADLDGLALDVGDLAALPSCKPGRCDVQLSAAAMRRFREGVSWKTPNAATEANLLARRLLLEWLETYLAGGLEALGSFDDRGPRRLSEEFQHLIEHQDFPEPLPDLAEALKNYPRTSGQDLQHVFYWSKVDFGLRPTIRLNHVFLMTSPEPRNGLVAVAATKQVYASHYFTSALELRFLVDDPERPGTGFYLLFLTKSRVPGLTGFLPSLVRRAIKSRARGTMERHLKYLKQIGEARES